MDVLAHWLIVAMPYAALSRMFVFIILSFFLYKEHSNTSLGRWIMRLFIATSCANGITAWLTWYLVRPLGDTAPHLDLEQWILLVGSVVFPAATAITGVMVTIWTIRESRNKVMELHATREWSHD